MTSVTHEAWRDGAPTLHCLLDDSGIKWVALSEVDTLLVRALGPQSVLHGRNTARTHAIRLRIEGQPGVRIRDATTSEVETLCRVGARRSPSPYCLLCTLESVQPLLLCLLKPGATLATPKPRPATSASNTSAARHGKGKRGQRLVEDETDHSNMPAPPNKRVTRARSFMTVDDDVDDPSHGWRTTKRAAERTRGPWLDTHGSCRYLRDMPGAAIYASSRQYM
jgi:hypothetical protein